MRKKGFTLIELLTALGILALMLAAVVPSYSFFRNQAALNAAAAQMVSEIKKAQETAMAEDKTASFSLEQILLPKGVKVKTGKTIIFSSSGFPPPGGFGTIVLENSSGRTKKIIISNLGRVRVE